MIGTGAEGVMQVRGEITVRLEKCGMTVFVEKSAKAAEIFNGMMKENTKAVLAIHLTC